MSEVDDLRAELAVANTRLDEAYLNIAALRKHIVDSANTIDHKYREEGLLELDRESWEASLLRTALAADPERSNR